MSDQMTLFDLMDEEEAAKYKPLPATDWKWSFKDYPKEKNGLKVFSCFACGGGSTMGYKLAGCNVLGCCEIDPKMNEVYVRNHHPKYNYLMDIRDFNKLEDLPLELYDLDILDGSPPCTTFSMAGKREEGWGKKKKFREGQKEQTLDDLSFIFIDTVKKLKPKTVIMENVEGLLLGEAWSYVQRIYQALDEAGYSLNHWLLKGENMGVPQRRHRVFFVAIRKDLCIDPKKIDMSFNYEQVPYKDIRVGSGAPYPETTEKYKLFSHIQPGDKFMNEACKRVTGKDHYFTCALLWPDNVLPTLTASCQTSGDTVNTDDCTKISDASVIHSQTFPEDYDATGINVGYICGMSVPPVMTKRIVQRLIDQGVYDYKLGGKR